MPVPKSASSRTSTGGITGSKPWPAQLLHRPAHERELEQDEVALEVGEARARQARAALHVDQLAGQLEMVLPVLAASPTSRRVVSASGAASWAGWASELIAARRRSSTSASSPLSCLLARADLTHRGDRLGDASSPAFLASAICSEAAFLRGPQLLQLGQHLAATRVERRAPRRRGRRSRHRGARARRGWRRGRRAGDCRSSTGPTRYPLEPPPEYLATNSATACAFSRRRCSRA